MKTHPINRTLPGLLAALLLWALSGCSLFPSSAPVQGEEREPAAVELRLGSAMPEDIVLRWDPAHVTVDSAEVTVCEEDSAHSRTTTVTIRLRPRP